MLRKLLVVCLAFGVMFSAIASPVQDAQARLKAAKAWLQKIAPQLGEDNKELVPAIEAVLERYYLEPDTLRASEKSLAEAFIATMPEEGDGLSGRGSAEDRMKDFESLLGAPAKPKPAKPAAKPPVNKPANKPPVRKAVVKKPARAAEPKPVVRRSTAKFKIPGITVRPTYSAVEKSAPGGKKIGAVMVSIDGRKKTVIEILTASGGMSLQKRAAVVASRMSALSNRNPLWWTTVKGGNARGEAVVRAAGAPGGFLVTADKQFAQECGLSPEQLAKQLAMKIRTTFDPERGDEFGGRDTTPEELRQAAIDLRQEGDDLFSTSKEQAEAKYKAAIQNDATYHVPYLRLADMYKAAGKRDDAKAILEQGLKVDGITGTQRGELEAKLRSI